MMLFPDDALFDYVLIDLAETVSARSAPLMQPLPCDRYVARSCLQKAIRRGEAELATRALANMFDYDRRAAWRAMTIIALEDVGVANVDLLAQIVAAQRNRKWRDQQGGDWGVMAELTRQMALSGHCQAACDLLMRAINDPFLDSQRAAALECAPADLSRKLWDGGILLEDRGIATLAMGGGLAEEQQVHEPYAVFDILTEAGRSSHVVATCRAAWKLSRNPMALLLPLIWEHWMLIECHWREDDPLPTVQMIEGVPGYALDQFTRIGNTISRALLRADPALRQLLEDAGVRSGAHSRAVGDLLFLIEGGLVTKRARWTIGEELRLPWRCLGSTTVMRDQVPNGLEHLRQKTGHVAKVRAAHFPPIS